MIPDPIGSRAGVASCMELATPSPMPIATCDRIAKKTIRRAAADSANSSTESLRAFHTDSSPYTCTSSVVTTIPIGPGPTGSGIQGSVVIQLLVSAMGLAGAPMNSGVQMVGSIAAARP